MTFDNKYILIDAFKNESRSESFREKEKKVNTVNWLSISVSLEKGLADLFLRNIELLKLSIV